MAEPFQIRFSKGEEGSTLTFSGQLIINHIDKIVGDVKQQLDQKSSLEVVIEACENIDITFIQFLISLQKTWMQNELEFSVKSEIKPEQMKLIENSGFVNLLK